jgi:hypothetical protein
MIPTKQISEIIPGVEHTILEHFFTSQVGTPSGIVSQGAGSGAVTLGTPDVRAFGISRLTTGATSVGGITLRIPIVFIFLQTNSAFSFQFSTRFRIPTDPVSTTETLFFALGFSSSTNPVEPTTGLYFFITSTDGVINAVSRKAGARVAVPMGVCPVNTWIEAKITLFKNGQAQFRINDNPPITFEPADISFGNGMGAQVTINKTAGSTTPSILEVDYIKLSLGQLPVPV